MSAVTQGLAAQCPLFTRVSLSPGLVKGVGLSGGWSPSFGRIRGWDCDYMSTPPFWAIQVG